MATHIGLDIGASSVKAVALRVSFNKTRLEALSSIDVAEAGSLDEAMRRAMANVTGGKPETHDGVAAALSGERIATRLLTLPASAQKQIGEVLPFELESELPFDTDDAVWDYRVLGAARPPSVKEDQLAVLTSVARTTDARARIEQVKNALGYEPERLGAGVFPLGNLVAVTEALRGAVVAIVDLGVERSEVLVLRDGESAFTRTLLVGTSGLPQNAPKLARELRTTLAAYRATGGPAVAKIVLAGGGAYVSGAESFLGQELGVPVERIGAPSMELNPSIGADTGFATYAKAVGLALSLGARATDPNLRKGPLAFERGFGWIKERLPVIIALGAAALVAFLVGSVLEIAALANERDTLEKALSTVTGEVLGEATDSADRANELLAKESSLIDEDPLPHADAFDVMVRLSESVPQSVVHDIEELDVQKGHVAIRGIVGSVNDAQEILKNLKSEPCFSNVTIKNTSQVVGGDRQKYSMEFDVKCPQDVKTKKKESAGAASASASSTGAKP